MGHYDDYYEQTYAEQRKQRREQAAKVIPQVISYLQNARNTIARNGSVVDFGPRIEKDLEFIEAALRGQLQKGE